MRSDIKAGWERSAIARYFVARAMVPILVLVAGLPTGAFAAPQCQKLFEVSTVSPKIEILVEMKTPMISRAINRLAGSQTGDPKYDRARNPFSELREEFIPADPLLAVVAKEINQIFQNKAMLSSFIAGLYRRILQDIEISEGSVAIDEILKNGGQIQSRKGIPTLFHLCEEVGWGPVRIVDKVYSETEFWRKVIAPARPFYDPILSREKHSASSHLLQLVFAKPIIDQKYGPDSFVKLLRYMGTTAEGGYLWGYLFDVPYNRRDIREPGSFRRMGFVGPVESLLGLD